MNRENKDNNTIVNKLNISALLARPRELMDQLVTMGDFLRFGMSVFNSNEVCFNHGTENSWDEAICLVAYAVNCEPNQLTENILNARLLREEKENILRLFKLRALQRIPVPYLTNVAWLSGTKFYVDRRALIPRSPIAELIEQHFKPWSKKERPEYLLDLCTGSGCLAVLCALSDEQLRVDAIDISEEALAVAAINIKMHQVGDRVKLIHSDLFQKLEKQRYDIIICNPPYVGLNEYSNLPEEFIHEPKLALLADNDGLEIVIKILHQASHYLTNDGILIVEVGNTSQTLLSHYPQVPFVWLNFERGGSGVFLLNYKDLKNYFNVKP